jgi:hypothetical protein
LNGIRLTIEMMPAFDNALLGAHRSLTACAECCHRQT